MNRTNLGQNQQNDVCVRKVSADIVWRPSASPVPEAYNEDHESTGFRDNGDMISNGISESSRREDAHTFVEVANQQEATSSQAVGSALAACEHGGPNSAKPKGVLTGEGRNDEGYAAALRVKTPDEESFQSISKSSGTDSVDSKSSKGAISTPVDINSNDIIDNGSPKQADDRLASPRPVCPKPVKTRPSKQEQRFSREVGLASGSHFYISRRSLESHSPAQAARSALRRTSAISSGYATSLGTSRMSSGGLSTLSSTEDIELQTSHWKATGLADSLGRSNSSARPSTCKALLFHGGLSMTPNSGRVTGFRLEYPLRAITDQYTISRGDDDGNDKKPQPHSTKANGRCVRAR